MALYLQKLHYFHLLVNIGVCLLFGVGLVA